MAPRFDNEYQPRKRVCGCSRCSNYIPTILEDDSNIAQKSSFNKYLGPILFATIISGVAIWQYYEENSKSSNSRDNNTPKLPSKLNE